MRVSQAVVNPAPRAASDAPRRAWRSRRGLLLFATIAIALWVVAWLSSTGAGLIDAAPREDFFSGSRVFAGWVHWDGEWYQRIAQDGYFFSIEVQSSAAFFPGYPLVLRGLSRIGGDPALWGISVTVISGAAVSLLFPDWCNRVGLRRAAPFALAALLLWPYAWFLYGAVYSDAMFLAFALGAFAMVERDRPVAAGLLGAVATATRPVGVAVLVALVVRVIERRRREGQPFAVRDAGVLLSASGLLAFMAYLQHRFDKPLAFAEAQDAPGWVNSPGPRTWFKYVVFERLADLPHSGTQYFGSVVVQAVLAIAFVALVPLIVRRLGYAYGIYTFMVVGIPLIESKDFYGLGRYCLAAFPAFAVIGDLLSTRPRLRVAWLVISAAGLVFLTGAYARGRYLA
jgi:hypothetical protein